MYVDNLCLTITKNCNLKCEHCLRGDRFNINISDETIKNTFSKINKIGMLVLTGGEPLLSYNTIDLINKIIKEIKLNNVKIDKILIFTNGTIYNEYIVKTLKELYALARSKSECILAISDDEYHGKEIERLKIVNKYIINTDKYNDLANEIGIKCGFKYIDEVTNIGRAKNLNINKIKPDYEKSYFLKFLLETLNFNYIENYMEVLKIDCDGKSYMYELSNDMIDEYTLFNINEVNDIINTMKNYYLSKYGIISNLFTGSVSPNRKEIKQKKKLLKF